MLSKQLRKASSIDLQQATHKFIRWNLKKDTETLMKKGEKYLTEFLRASQSLGADLKINNFRSEYHEVDEPFTVILAISTVLQSTFGLKTRKACESFSEYLNDRKCFFNKCEQLSISQKDAGSISRFFQVLNLELPKKFTLDEMDSLLKSFQNFSVMHKNVYKESLRSELRSLENVLTPQKLSLTAIKSKAQIFADRLHTFGTGSLIVGTYYSVLYPCLDIFTSANYTLCTSYLFLSLYILSLKTSFPSPKGIQKLLFTSKLERLKKESEIDSNRILDLQEEIEGLRKELIDLH